MRCITALKSYRSGMLEIKRETDTKELDGYFNKPVSKLRSKTMI